MENNEKTPKYKHGDMVAFRFVSTSKTHYNGVILDSWGKRGRLGFRYTIASMNHGMSSYTISEDNILKSIA